MYATALADYSAAMHLVQGILLALLHRERTGKGQQVDVSLYDSMLAMQTQEASMWMMRQERLNWAAMPLTGVFDTKDGAVVLVGAFKKNPLGDICTALEMRVAAVDVQSLDPVEVAIVVELNPVTEWTTAAGGVPSVADSAVVVGATSRHERDIE